MLKHLYKGLVTIVLYLLGYTPLPLLHAFGFLIGTLIFLLPIRIRYYVATNIRLCFPHLRFWPRQLLTWRALRETAKSWFESPVFWVRSPRALLRLIQNQQTIQPIVEAVAHQKGALILGTHIGGYYLKNAILGRYLPSTTYLYKPQRGILNDIMAPRRNRFGSNLVSTSKEGVLTLFRHLKTGGAVGMACDHNVLDYGAIYIPFFGIPVPAMTLPSRLAEKTRVPAFMAVMERLSWGRGYRFHVWPANEGIYSPDLATSATAVSTTLEGAIKRFPTQHEWLYRRFWDRPAGEPPIYKTQL